MFFLQHGYRVDRPRPPRPRPLDPDRRRPRHGSLRRRPGGRRSTHLDLQERRPRRPLDRRRRGGALSWRVTARAASAKAVLISAVPPLMVKTEANPGGLPKEVFDGFQAQVADQSRRSSTATCRRARSTASTGPARSRSRAIIDNWWRQGMMGGAKAHYDGIVAFSQTDFTEDLKKITVPTLVMHGDDDQIVPYADSGPAVGQAAEERDAEDLQGLSARHADDRGRRRSTPTCWPLSRSNPAVRLVPRIFSGMADRAIAMRA